ncbi:MAG TPA: A24 family peptidase [Burkholderiales bacterium]|nr:A24 family peptidase [Burkholderiales bacterium]
MSDTLKAVAHPAVFPLVCLAIGLVVGSFLNVVIHRLPKMMERQWREDLLNLPAEPSGSPAPPPRPKPEKYNLFVPRSRCPACGHGITAIENIPVLSWAVLRGRCSACKARISVRYPLVELLAGIGAFASANHFGFSMAAVGASIFIWCTIALAFIDQETGYLFDDITLPLLWLGLLLNLGRTYVPIGDAVIGAAAGYLVLWGVYWLFKLVTGKEGMGYGDFKLNAAVGAFLGWQMLPLVILLSSIVGTVFGIAQMLAAKGGWEWNFRFHFGPYLAIAGIVALFWGPQLTRQYFSQFM